MGQWDPWAFGTQWALGIQGLLETHYLGDLLALGTHVPTDPLGTAY